ncbi:DnaJ C-terminal domain-containing protein [Daejeonella sp.]|uniref:DnaJ C-terminal domain-containing protein n=1 Tax=Daejeonella sp. TaxID=2805397 RepID=UPI0039837DC1
MSFVDYYQALGTTKSATEKDIKAAYRKMARKYHPDVNPNDKDAQKKFQEVNEANEVLSDPEKRKKYDQYGKDWKHADQFQEARQSQHRQQQQQPRGQQDFGGEDYSDFFSSMFGRGKQRPANFKGQDFNAELRLNLRDVYTSQKQTLTINGKNIRLTIPAGIENGQTIKITGHGGPGMQGGPAGDLYIKFAIANDPEFKRVGNDLYKALEIDLQSAVLGGEITVDTLSGKVKLKVNPETQNGTKVKLKGKGFPIYKKETHFGDLYITYSVKIPTGLTDKQKELFKQIFETDK